MPFFVCETFVCDVSFSVVCVMYSCSLSHLYCSSPRCVCLLHVAVKRCKPVSVHLNTAHMETMEPTAVTGVFERPGRWRGLGMGVYVHVCRVHKQVAKIKSHDLSSIDIV